MKYPATLAAAAALAGCTIIPPPDPSRMAVERPPAAERAPYTEPAPAAPPPPEPGPVYAPEYAPVGHPELPPARPDAAMQPGLTYAALGQTVRVDGPRVTPLEVLEDSRCSMNARCMWAGQVRLRVRIESGRREVLELTSGKPVSVADGSLELVEVRPDKLAGEASRAGLDPSTYRFGLRFAGGY